ncbi:uncharacterized protein LOC129231153 [Uloborus diversus]|uniref:uncharacterized protein LOC129231153 n=1 Tax=Uloborus diversus TaxID=327109 RepID=UPI0024097662|nr:uncharacterized protein LOC129231153 [Uloborus diversus]
MAIKRSKEPLVSCARSHGQLLEKNLVGGSDAQGSGNSHVSEINAEIRALREQLMRSQVLFTYLLKDASSENTPKSSEDKGDLHALLEDGNLRDAIFHCKSFDGQVPPRFCSRSNRSSSSYASHKSTPMHCGYISVSCPILPVESPVATKATQTETAFGVSFYLGRTSAGGFSSDSLNKDASVFYSSTSSPCDSNPKTLLLSEVCDIHRDPDPHSYPRQRTNSFLAAVKDGNPKLIDATYGANEKSIKLALFGCERRTKEDDSGNIFPGTELRTNSNVQEGEKSVVDDSKECPIPRRLSILLEEEYEDVPGNCFNSQPFPHKKRKHLPSCSVNTQTDLCLAVNSNLSSDELLPFKKKKSEELPVTEFFLTKQGYTIVMSAVEKKTVYSKELPQKVVSRHPPPYTKNHWKTTPYIASEGGYFNQMSSRHRSRMHKWNTVSESLLSKSQCSQPVKTHNEFSLQTRHLSLEKQESFSSCDHSLYPDSQISSITDCSAWMNRSDIDLHQKSESFTYQQSQLPPHQNQPAKNRMGDITSEWRADSREKNPPPPGSGESTSVHQGNKEKSENFEKLSKARSMRRGSGAGSPNSLLTIPRCPAFDFGEQEDAHFLFPSPSEPEGYQSIKPEMQREKSNPESVQSSSQLSDTSQKKKDTNKLKTLMPELMENSETESAKGSFECEPSDATFNLESSVAPFTDIAFPSLPNTFLAKLGVHKDSPLSVEGFDEQELESKFVALSLAFKTDRTTLNKRIDLHKRQRDMAEKNVENEFQAMREHLNTLNLKAVGSDIRDLISKIQNHLDIAQQATSRLSGRAEIYGSVQQEERVSRAFEVLVLHVDHLKRLFDKEHKELEETRKLLTDSHAFRRELGADIISEDQKKYLKSFALPIGTIKSVRFDEQELESKFVALSLAFKTDRTTLNKRIDLHKRQRDMAEKNVENEFQAMREHLNTLNLKAVGSDIRDLISKIQNHLDIAQQATSRLSGRAEIYGSVQQEERVSRAFEVLVLHVDHLKRLFDKEHKELEETRKLLTDSHAFRRELGADIISEDQKKYLKSFALPIGTIKSEIKHSSSLLPTVSSLGLSSDSQPPSSATSSFPSRICITETRARRSSLPVANPIIPSLLPKSESSSEDFSHSALSLDKRCLRKKERNNWTRKLSSVTDERELSEEEEEENVQPPDVTERENAEHETETRDVKLIFLKQVESKINDSYKNINESLGDIETGEESRFTQEIHKTDDSTPEKSLYFDDWPGISILYELWEENSAWTSVRLISSTLFIFVALCIFLFSLIIPCLSGHIFTEELGDCNYFLFTIRQQKHHPSS